MRMLLIVVVALLSQTVQGQETGYQKEASVRQATRLDWTFALSNQSLAAPPAEWLPGYDSTQQRYELFVLGSPQTAGKKPSKSTAKPKQGKAAAVRDALPLVLFISPGDLPAQYAKQRKEMLEAAINLWMMVVQDGQDAQAVADAEQRLPELKKLLDRES